MIIKVSHLEKLVKEHDTFFSILIYGSNEGLVKDQIDKIVKNYLVQDECEKISLNGKELDSDPQTLEDLTRSVSMFYKSKVVIASDIKDKHLKLVEDVILNEPDRVFLIFREGNLNKSSKIRKFFESNEKCYSLPCYEDDGRSMIRNIEEFIKNNNIELNRDTKNYLLQSLSNDRMVSKRELEKIEIYYKDSKAEVELDTVKDLLNDNSSQNLNKMNESVMFGNTAKSSKIINKLLSEGVNPISLIRSLSSYLARVQRTKIEMKKGNNFENSIKILKPPVFWKDKDSFQKHCLKWPLAKIEKSLSKLLETEVVCKLNSRLASFNCEKSILFIASHGKQYFKN